MSAAGDLLEAGESWLKVNRSVCQPMSIRATGAALIPIISDYGSYWVLSPHSIFICPGRPKDPNQTHIHYNNYW